jgi:hypothetical protein
VSLSELRKGAGMSKTLKRAAFTFGILALAGAIFVAGGFAGRSLAGDSEYQKGKEATMIDAAEALQVLMPAFELRDAGPIVPVPDAVPDADLCEAVRELNDLYEPLRPWYTRIEGPGPRPTMGGYMDPAPKEIWDAAVRYCEQ